MRIAAALFIGLTAGVFASDFFLRVFWLFRGSVEVRCIQEGICVGDDGDSVLYGWGVDDRVGGLTSIFCGEPYKNPDYIHLADLVQGKTCGRETYTYHFNNTTFGTDVTVSGGKITKIEQGPLHIIDF